jgi:hypothetical protein
VDSDPPAETVQGRLDRLRGRALPVNHSARTISALAANPGCPRRALLDASGTDKQKVAAHAGFPARFGQSRFAITRGNAFESMVKADGAGPLLALLREQVGLPVPSAHYHDMNEAGGQRDSQLRHQRTRQLLSAADPADRTLFDHPLLRLRVGGRFAYLEPDLLALHHDGMYHVVEIKSFPVIDGQADPAKVAAAAIQSAVYVHALRDLLGDEDKVHHETILVAPRDFSSRPVATRLDVRRQLGVLRRQLARIANVADLLDGYQETLTFDLAPDGAGRPRRPAAELRAAIGAVDANYTPDCLATCELCFLCRDEAAATTGALGKDVREDLGGIEHVAAALDLARGGIPEHDQAEAAVQLMRAASLRGRILGEAV